MGAVHMECPRCGESSANLDCCEFCGVDLKLYKKAVDMSQIYYNKGLRMAGQDNLTYAIECLDASLQINKKNVIARNLLGLCYFATGRVGEALREWVISSNYEEKNNPAQEYLDIFNFDMPLLERFSDGLRNYNEALRYLEQKSEDLAVIRLKRAIELIPSFVDAINLLTLVHIKNGDKMRAGGLVEQALAIDAANPVARSYYREIFRKKAPVKRKGDAADFKETVGTAQQRQGQRPGARQGGGERGAGHSPFGVQNQKVFNKRSPISGILSFVVGLGAMFLFMYVLVMPSFLEDALAENARLTSELSALEASHHEQIGLLEEDVERLRDDIARAANQAAIYQNRILDADNANWVNNGYAFLAEGLHAEALSAIEAVDVNRLSPESLEIYNMVRAAAMPVVEQHYFSLGQGFFNGNNFPEALNSLERALGVTRGEGLLTDHVLFYLGQIAENDGNFDLARQYFETIVNDFPGSNRVNAANLRLNAIAQ